MSITNVTPDTYKSMTEKTSYILLDFSADWCPPCKVMHPIVEAFSNDPELKHIQFGEVDVDEEQDISQSFNISAMPTFVIVKSTKNDDGSVAIKEVKRWIGAQPNPLTFKMDILKAAPQD